MLCASPCSTTQASYTWYAAIRVLSQIGTYVSLPETGICYRRRCLSACMGTVVTTAPSAHHRLSLKPSRIGNFAKWSSCWTRFPRLADEPTSNASQTSQMTEIVSFPSDAHDATVKCSGTEMERRDPATANKATAHTWTLERNVFL